MIFFHQENLFIFVCVNWFFLFCCVVFFFGFFFFFYLFLFLRFSTLFHRINSRFQILYTPGSIAWKYHGSWIVHVRASFDLNEDAYATVGITVTPALPAVYSMWIGLCRGEWKWHLAYLNGQFTYNKKLNYLYLHVPSPFMFYRISNRLYNYVKKRKKYDLWNKVGKSR